MNEVEHNQLVEEKGIELPDTFIFSDFNGVCAVNNRIALTLEAVSSVYEFGEQIEVDDESGQSIGVLCLCKGKDLDLSTISEIEYSAYISEVEPILYAEPYSFKYDYLVIDVNRVNEYRANYEKTSALWGSFIHKEPGLAINNYKIRPISITAKDGLGFPTSFHRESCFRSVLQPYTFERFLKLYHLLELLFDQEIVKQINALGTDLQGIGKILSNYKHSEIERLRFLINTKCTNFLRIEFELNRIGNSIDYLAKARTIFFDYGKTENPLKEKQTEFEQMILNGGFSEASARSFGVTGRNSQTGQYNKLLAETTSYWIYRIRSSIAHHRIGEYLMTNEDEEFVTEVIEPLLREILYQSFKI